MRNYTRFSLLLLMALLLAVPLAAPRPVQASRVQGLQPAPAAQAADTELVPGHYRGWFFLEANLTAHTGAQPPGGIVDFNVREKWKGEGTVDVVVTGKEAATATVKLEKFGVSITDNNIFSGNGVSCSWYSILLAKGTWAPQEGSYKKDVEDFEIPIQFLGIYSYDHVEGQASGSLKGCDSRWAGRTVDVMKLAMDQASTNLIKELDLMVYEVGMDGTLSGSCLLPGFDVELDIPNGHTSRFSACNWQVFPVQDEPKKGWW